MNEQRSTDAPIVINHVQRQAFAQQQRQASSQFMQTQVQPVELQSNNMLRMIPEHMGEPKTHFYSSFGANQNPTFSIQRIN